jgi:hypothetical protein
MATVHAANVLAGKTRAVAYRDYSTTGHLSAA